MSDRRGLRFWAFGAGAAALFGLAGWGGYSWWVAEQQAQDQPVKTSGTTALDEGEGPSDITTVDVTPDAAQTSGVTPMNQRVATLGFLNKRNGQSRDLTLKPGEAIRVGDAVVRLRACEETAPWETDHYTGAFVQLDREMPNKKWRRVFSGWLFRERPSLNVIIDPLYDISVKSCAMRFPGPAPEAAPPGNGAASNASSAAKSPAAEPDEPVADDAGPAGTPPATTPDTADASNPR